MRQGFENAYMYTQKTYQLECIIYTCTYMYEAFKRLCMCKAFEVT